MWEIVVGILKGFDQLMNLVLDEVKETLRGMLIELRLCDRTMRWLIHM